MSDLFPKLPPPPKGLNKSLCLDGTEKHDVRSDSVQVWCAKCWQEFPCVEDFVDAAYRGRIEVRDATTEQKVAACENFIARCYEGAERTELQKLKILIDDPSVDEHDRRRCQSMYDELMAVRQKRVDAALALPPLEPRERRRR